MKVKFSMLLLMLLTAFSEVAWATTEPPTVSSSVSESAEVDVCAMVSSVETWLEGQVLEGNTLMAYFNTTQSEFIDFATANDINSLKIDFYWQSNSGGSIQWVQSSTIDDIYSGFSVDTWAVDIENADIQTGIYVVRVTINETECGELVELPIVNEEVEDEEEELPVELPEFECGDTYVNENITNQDPLAGASPGEYFYIGGFPVLLETVTGNSGVYSGTALVPLPFKKKVVKVDFQNISVNTDREIWAGELVAKPGDPADYPDFVIDPEPLSIGGDICLPPPPPPGYGSDGVNEVTGLNDWGFDPETGLHGETGTEYDENGFDIYGNHADTGGPFNEQGCNREGFDIDDNPCDPSGGPNPEAEAFADNIAPTIGTDISGIISTLQTALQDSLNALGCPAIRTELDGLVTTLGYNREFIFGEGDKYLNEGMHLEFENEPKPLVLNIERDNNAKLLEQRHVDLYHCDRASYAINAFLNALNAMASGQGLEDVKAEILQRIRDWTDYQYGLYHDDPDAFNEWLTRQIGNIMMENSGLDSSYVSTDAPAQQPSYETIDEHMRSIFDFKQNTPYYNTTASVDHQFAFDETFTLEDASFYFRQGHQTINGVDRAFYLEGLAKQLALVSGGQNLLPIKVQKTVGNKSYTIYLDGIVFTPVGAILDAYIIIEDPESGKRFVFKGLDIGFGPTGMDVESRLELGSDVEIRLNNAAMLILKGTENTYVAWDCEGFSGMGIDAEIEFCRNFIIPLDESTLEPKPDPERYRLAVTVEIPSWLEFTFVANAKPFAIAQYQEVKWELTNMVVDFSSTTTPQFTPLDGYESPFWDGSSMAPMWKGFYVDTLAATLPNELSSGSEPITAGATNLLIDDCGVSGGVFVENLINIEEGNMGGWPFSIDAFSIRILKNQFAGAGMGGDINVPIFKEYMEYEAIIYPGSFYKFTVTPADTITMDMFLATGEIYDDSSIEVELKDGEFTAVATLNGNISVSTDNNADVKLKLDFPDLCFQDFQVSNKAPYFSPGTWGLSEDTDTTSFGFDFNGFGLRLSKLMPYGPGPDETPAVPYAGLGFNVDVELSGAVDVNAGGGFKVEGILEENEGRQKWVYSTFSIQSFHVDASFQGVTKIKGVVEWYDQDSPGIDPKWGEGFRGLLSANFKGLNVSLKAAAQFGKVDDYKYFFVDALAEFGAVGPGTGVLQLKGFGGGVSYRMDTNYDAVNLTAGAGTTLPPIGVSISGASYVPDQSKGLGLKATAVIATTKEEIFSGTVSLAFLFNNGGGINKINIIGSGQFLKTIDLGILPKFVPNAISPPESVDASLSAFIDLEFNFDEPSFHGSLNVFLNAGAVRGAGDGGKMVDAQIHFDPTEWYIYIGRPEEGQRCGVKFTVPGVGSVYSEAYMDIGTNVPPMAPIPNKVREIAYKINNNQSLRQSGAGFVLGASIGFEMSASIAGIVSATLEAEAGFDLMLRKYEGLRCQGSSDEVGIDGWYASGQIWAYVYGELKVFGVNIASAGIAAALQARLPNPFWAQATVGVKIKLLFVTVRKSLKLELGNDCILVSDNPTNGLGMEVIAFLEPFSEAVGIETNAKPTAYMALEFDKDFVVPNLNGGESTFKVTFKSSKLTYSSNINIPHTYEISEDKTSVILHPEEMLPPNEDITFEVEVRVYKNGSFLTNETKSVTFTTGAALDYIPESNVESTYPLNGMANYHKKEYNQYQGYIQLKAGMPDLLLDIPEGYYQRMRLTTASGSVLSFNYEYDALNRRVTFPLPSPLLNGGKVYKVDIVRKESSTSGPSDGTPVATASSQPLSLALGGAADGPPAGGNTGDGNTSSSSSKDNGPTSDDNSTSGPEQPMEHVLYSIYFRVSEYDTFLDKLNAIIAGESGLEKPLDDIEGFGTIERTGGSKYDPIIEFTTDINVPWINDDVKPFFTSLAPYVCEELAIDYDEFKKSGRISGPGVAVVDQTHFESGEFTMPEGQKIILGLDAKVQGAKIAFYSQIFMCSSGLIAQLSESCSNGFGCFAYNQAMDTINQPLPEMQNGTYKMTVKYRLPGVGTTSSKVVNFIK